MNTTQSRKQQRFIRALKILVALNAVTITLAIVLYFQVIRTDPRASVDHDGLRGSKPPANQVMPDFSSWKTLEPRVPSFASFKGATLILGTCIDCPSGDVLGGAMRRLGQRDWPRNATVMVIGWDGDAERWREEWSLPEKIRVHMATTPEAAIKAQRELGVGETGYAYLFDSKQRWRSSFAAQQMLPDDIIHDMKTIG